MKGLIDFVKGAMWGTMVGATVGLLFAPSRGRVLRDQMQQRVETIQREVKNAAEERRIELERELAILRAPKQTPPSSQL